MAEELKAILARLDSLEKENASLKRENESLKANTEQEEEKIRILPSAHGYSRNPAAVRLVKSDEALCNACLNVYNRRLFSKSQLKKVASIRRCEFCTTSGKELSDAAKLKVSAIHQRRIEFKEKKREAKERARQEERDRLEAAEKAKREADEAALQKAQLEEQRNSMFESFQAINVNLVEQWKEELKLIQKAILRYDVDIELEHISTKDDSSTKLSDLKEKRADMEEQLRETALRIIMWS